MENGLQGSDWEQKEVTVAQASDGSECRKKKVHLSTWSFLDDTLFGTLAFSSSFSQTFMMFGMYGHYKEKQGKTYPLFSKNV